MKLLTSTFLMSLLLLTLASAAESFTVSYTPINDSIYIDQIAEYELTIRNFDILEDRYRIFSSNPSWGVIHENPVIIIQPKNKETFTLLLDPASTLPQARRYSVPLTIESLTDGERENIDIPVLLFSNELRQFRPAIFVDATIGERNIINPLEPFEVQLRFINKNPLDIESLRVKLVGDLINEEFEISLGPNEQITKLLSFKLDPQTQPQQTTFDVELTANDKELGSVKRVTAQVVASQPGFERQITIDDKEFLKDSYEVQFTNIGNIVAFETVRIEKSLWESLFTTKTPGSKYEQVGNMHYLTYDLTLQPGESTRISVITSYQTFAVVLGVLALIAIASIGAYYAIRSPLIVQKRVQVLDSGEEGVVSRLKVMLDIKNRTSSVIENIKVIERLPNITEVDKEFVMGTLKPTKIISSGSKGTLIRWDFASLEPFEERIITYNVKSKLVILGNVQLPPTMVKFDSGNRSRTVEEKAEVPKDSIERAME